MYAIGMAYCGTSNNSAIRRLLHVAVSDVSDDVRLAAVTCLGFVLFRTPEQVTSVSKVIFMASEDIGVATLVHVGGGGGGVVGIY